MPQPVSASVSALTQRPWVISLRTAETGASAVIVVAGPNITCPMSALSSGCALRCSASSGRAGGRAAAGPAAVGVELQVGEMGAAAVERAHRVERRAVVAGDAEV